MSAPSSVPPVNPALDADVPALPWCVAKGLAWMVLLAFLLVFLPLELLGTVLSIVPIQFPLPTDLLVLGGLGIAIFSGASTMGQTTRLYGIFRFLGSLFRLGYLFGLALNGFLGLTLNVGSNSTLLLRFGFAPIIYLFMIGSALAAIAYLITFIEDLKHPGERLPFDFPLTREQKRNRALSLSAGLPPVGPS